MTVLPEQLVDERALLAGDAEGIRQTIIKREDGWSYHQIEVPAGTELDRQLGFVALAITVDNSSDSWVFVPQIGRFIGPWQSATMYITGTQRARLQWSAPSGQAQPTANALQWCQITFWSERPTIVPQQTSGIAVVRAAFTTALDYDASNNLIFLGKAAMGSAKTAAVWQIRNLLYDASNNLTDVQWAGGDQTFVNVWNNRASLTYK